MARRKKVGKISTGAMLGIAGAAVVGVYLLSKSGSQAPPVIVHTMAPSSSAATTAAEITAGGAVVTAALNDFFGPDDSGS